MILNELSLATEGESKEEVKNRISEFLKVCQKLSREKRGNFFYYTEELLLKPLSEDYTLHDWLKDPVVMRREKDFFRSLINRGIMIKDDQFSYSELFVNVRSERKASIGCLAAYEWDNYVVSLLSDDLWENEYIYGEYCSIVNDTYYESEVGVQNCSKEEHVNKLMLYQRRRDKLLISSGAELWNKREELFPHLSFCESVKKQLEEARVTMQIQTVINRIQILEDYFSTYDGKFDKDKVGYGCRYESDSVQQDERLSNMRKFRTPYGEEVFFYWHISFPGNYPGRIHFLPDAEHKRGIIGYVGKHLPTSKYPTI